MLQSAVLASRAVIGALHLATALPPPMMGLLVALAPGAHGSQPRMRTAADVCAAPAYTALSYLFKGRDVVEIAGSAPSDGIGLGCYARQARSSLAVESVATACTRLTQRAARSSANFSVACEPLFSTCFDADFVTWQLSGATAGPLPAIDAAASAPSPSPAIPAPPQMIDSMKVLMYLNRLLYDGLLRPNATAAVLFDGSCAKARRQWVQMAPFAYARATVPNSPPLLARSVSHRIARRTSSVSSADDAHVAAARSSAGPLSATTAANVTIALFRISDMPLGGKRPKQPNRKCPVLRRRPLKTAPGNRTKPAPPPPAAIPLDLPAAPESGRPYAVRWATYTQWEPFDPLDTRCETRCDMVIAQCDEPLEWLTLESPRHRRIFVYTKCGKSPEQLHPSFRSLPNVEFIPSPNVGSNDYAILQHVIHRHEQLADITLFCEGGEHYKCIPDAVLRPSVGPSGTQVHLAAPPAPPPSLWLAPASTLSSAGAATVAPMGGYSEFAEMWWRYPWLSHVDANISYFRFKKNYSALRRERLALSPPPANDVVESTRPCAMPAQHTPPLLPSESSFIHHSAMRIRRVPRVQSHIPHAAIAVQRLWRVAHRSRRSRGRPLLVPYSEWSCLRRLFCGAEGGAPSLPCGALSGHRRTAGGPQRGGRPLHVSAHFPLWPHPRHIHTQ